MSAALLSSSGRDRGRILLWPRPLPACRCCRLPLRCLLLSLVLFLSFHAGVFCSGPPGGVSPPPPPASVADYVVTSNSLPLPDLGSYDMSWLTFKANEAPNIELQLPWAFPWWGSLQSTVFLSPNGAVQFDNTLPCCLPCGSVSGQCCYFMNYADVQHTATGPVSACSFAVNYYNLLAISLTDLAPANAGEVGYGYAPNAWRRTGNTTVEWDPLQPFIIQYRNIPLAISSSYEGVGETSLLSPSGVNYTFGCGLYTSGRIDFYYWEVSDPVEYGGWGDDLRLWLVGLRQPDGQGAIDTWGSQYADPNDATLPSNGTYVNRRTVVNSTTFSFWPVGSQSCSAPLYSLPEGNSSIVVVLKDYDNSTAAFSWSCSFQYEADSNSSAISLSPALYSADEDELLCTAPPALVGTILSLTLLADGVELPISPSLVLYVNSSSLQAAGFSLDPDSFEFLTEFCAQCAAFRPSFCWYDCSGTLHGTAVIDSCDECVLGNTGRQYDAAMDCLGICYGSFALNDGQCVCPGGPACQNLARVTNYLSPSTAQYAYSLNGSLLPLDSTDDEVVSYDDPRFQLMPYSFDVSSEPFPFFLQFVFPFYDGEYDLIYISPLGALLLELPSPTCLANACIRLYDGLNDCSYSMVAGYLAEYDYNFSTEPQYSYLSTSDVFVMRYNRMHLASSSVQTPLLSFTISLFPSGRVLLQYESIVPPSQLSTVYGLPYTRQAVIGMITAPRPIAEMLSVYPSPFLPSSTDANGLYALQVENEWRSTAVSTGVFPSRSLIASSGTLDFIPFGTNICIAPYFGRSTGGELLHINPALWSPYLPYLQLHCAIHAELTPAVYNATLGSYDCTTPPGIVDGTVAVDLATPGGQLLTSNRVYYTYYDPDSLYVRPQEYAQYYSTDGLCSQCFSLALSIDTLYCYLDCADEWRGGAYRDDCGSCVGGGTGIAPDIAKDCYGTCFGPYLPHPVSGNRTQCSCSVSTAGISGSGCDNVPVMQPTPQAATQYIDSFNSSSLPDFLPFNATGLLVQPSATLTAIELPFSFPYYAALYRQLLVDTDGAVYLTNTTADCLADGSASLFAGNDSATNSSCLHMLIAAALTDYSTPAPTAYSLMADRAVLQYQQGEQRFTITLTVDGSIELGYQAVQDSGGNWLVGAGFGLPSALLMPFPFFVTAASYIHADCAPFQCSYASLPTSYVTPTQRQFLPSTPFTAGYYPERALFASPTYGSLVLCPVSIFLCLTPQQGTSKGGTLLTVYSNVTACTSEPCCASQLNMSCNVGGIVQPAWFDLSVMAWRCLSPAGLPRTLVNFWLEESGRQLGTAQPLFFLYNDSAVQAVTAADQAVLTCLDCSAQLSTFCWQDCTGSYRGNATYDECGQCRPPANTTAVAFASDIATIATFPYQPVQDCLGICFGPFVQYTSTPVVVPDVVFPQCGCMVFPEPTFLQRQSFLYTTLCAVWQRLDGGGVLSSTLSSLGAYQIFVFVCVLLLLAVAAWLEGVKAFAYVKRRMKMTPAERERERRRRERRRQRERDRRERRRRLALGLPLPNQEPLPPGVAAIPAPLPDSLAGSAATQPSQSSQAPAASASAASSSSAAAGADLTGSERAALSHLHTMGFSDDATLLPLIRRCRGDVNSVINQLLR